MARNYSGEYKKQLLSSPGFLSCQPGYFSPALNYREYHVPAADPLHSSIALLYEASARIPQLSIPVIPDGCIDVVFSFQAGACMGVSVCGTITTFYSMEFKDNDCIFGIRFLPGKFPLQWVGPIEPLLNHQQPLPILDQDQALIQQMAAADFETRVNLVLRHMRVFCLGCDDASYKQGIVNCSMQQICTTTGNLNIRALSDELIYSPRYIERIFKDYTGFSPKSMCRLARMHKAVLMLLWDESNSRTDISAECGYADLSHMNRDLYKLLGIHSTEINMQDFYAKSTEEAVPVYKF